jgi:steroid 5-alpha reductase family enzyme
MSLVTMFAAAVAMITLVFGLAWYWAVKIDNYSMVDAFWAFGIGFVGLFWLLCSHILVKHWIAAAMLLLWSVRLGYHLQRRIRHHFPAEDSRYVKLREHWQERVQQNFFWFFQAQSISCIVLALPFFCVACDTKQNFSLIEWIGVIFFIVGVIGESLADSQMTAFKKTNLDPKALCRDGLWYYSRHPNYFFESVIWFSFYIYACGSEYGWMTIHAPVIITYLLLKVTGIPPTEAASLLRRGDSYRQYQATTSAFIPWPPKNGH